MWKYDVGTGIWTWMSGSQNTNDSGSYVSKGMPSVNNCPAGRVTNCFWKDNSGNFWLSGGGEDFGNVVLQDIWSFNPQTLQWTWVKGLQGKDTSTYGIECSPDSSDKEGALYENRANWKICDNALVTYGGYTIPYLGKNDMWAYQSNTNEWVKVNSWPLLGNYGVTDTPALIAPPYRTGSVGFKDRNNNLWMFGGGIWTNYGNGTGFLNDLWKYVMDTTCISLSCSRSCNLAPPLITTNENIFCSDDSTQICALSGYASYQWNAGVTGTGNCIYAKQAGDYYVTITDINGCTAESNHLPISVYPVTPASIIRQGDTLSSYGAVSYQWFLNNNPITNATGPIYIAGQQGLYSIR